MTTLPASVRLSLWVTSAWSGRLDLTEAMRRALPDVDHVDGDVSRLRLWQDLGERVLVCALPRPGGTGGMPHCGAELLDAATQAGECVFVPGIGGALVPTLEEFGPQGDTGTTARLTGFDCDPVPAHRLESVSQADVEREFRSHLTGAIGCLEGLDVGPWAGSGLRDRADRRLRTARWGLPPEMPERALHLLQQASTASEAAGLGLEHSHAVQAGEDRRRHGVLRDLRAAADTAMAGACTVAALTIAGMRPGR